MIAEEEVTQVNRNLSSDVGAESIDAKQTLYECELCHGHFLCKTYLYLHMKRCGRKKSKMQSKTPNLCDICGKTFTRSHSLFVHGRIHRDEKPFNCVICQKSFRSRYQLNVHARVHTGERPYECEICCKTFVVSGRLAEHMKKAHGVEEPYKCKVCYKVFGTSFAFNVHEKCHNP